MKNILQNKLAIPLLALAIVGIGGSVYTLSMTGPTTADAQQVQTQNAVSDKPESPNDKPDGQAEQKQEPTFTSSIRIDDTKEVDDSVEAKTLASLAKISADQAKVAAEKSAGGTASSVKLENENGNVVYVVTVGVNEVKVDAGNGAILKTEAVDNSDSKEKSD